MTILADMDDVLDDLLSSWCAELNKISEISLTPKDVKYWDMSKNYPDLSHEEIVMPLQKREFWKNVSPKQDAPEILKKMIDKGHKVFVVTASSPTSLVPKMNEMLFRHFPYLTWNDVIVAARKDMIKGDVLIDDNLDNLLCGGYRKILFKGQTAIYDNIRNIDGIEYCCSWKEIYDLLIGGKK